MTDEAASLPTQMGEDEWHEKTGQVPNIATKMAYFVITGSPHFVRSRMEYMEKYHSLYELCRLIRRRGIEMAMNWRFPGYNLDLLQLATLVNNESAVRLFYAHSVDSTPDGDGNLQDHHFLLDCAYRKGSFFMDRKARYAKSFPFKKGFVTVALNPSLTPEAPVVHLDTPLHGSCLDFALQTKNLSLVLRLVPEYFALLERTNFAQAIEYLWLALDCILQNESMNEYCLACLVPSSSCKADISKNLFLLCCQLLNAPSEYVGSSSCLTGTNLALYLLARAVHGRKEQGDEDFVSLLVRHCTRTQLQLIISSLEDESKARAMLEIGCPHTNNYLDLMLKRKERVLEALRKELDGRTLQHETMLTILRSVGGDARRAKTLSDLPEPLLELFQVPFKDLHDRLTGSRQ